MTKVRQFCTDPRQNLWKTLPVHIRSTLLEVARFCVRRSKGAVGLASRILTLGNAWTAPSFLPVLKAGAVPGNNIDNFGQPEMNLGTHCDGYWSQDVSGCLKYGDKYSSSAPEGCPQRRIRDKPWATKALFLAKLRKLERYIEGIGRAYRASTGGRKFLEISKEGLYPGRNCGTEITKGYSVSRIVPESDTREHAVGSLTFSIRSRNGLIVCWPSQTGRHYFEKYNVLPSKQLYEAVMNYILPIETWLARDDRWVNQP